MQGKRSRTSTSNTASFHNMPADMAVLFLNLIIIICFLINTVFSKNPQSTEDYIVCIIRADLLDLHPCVVQEMGMLQTWGPLLALWRVSIEK